MRFDKFQDIDISWRDEELEHIIDKRLYYYSIDKRVPVTLRSLISFDNDRKTILSLAGGSPRSLISLMSRLYDEEMGNAAANGNVVSFSSATISTGLVEFCRRFDYESLQPSKVSDKNNYYNWLNKVLLMKKPYFTISEICSVFNIKATTARTYISQMEKLGIISPDASGGDDTIYRTTDPRINYLMSRGVLSLS